MAAHTLGNPFPLKAVREFCDRYGLWLIEDNCDALGSTYEIDGEIKMTGTIGDIGTSSFYPPHHMTMGEGGGRYIQIILCSTRSSVLLEIGGGIAPVRQDGIICAGIGLTSNMENYP